VNATRRLGGTALAAACLAAAVAQAQAPGVLAVAFDSARWELEGNAKQTRIRGRDCLMLDGAAALVKDFELQDGVIDVDVTTAAKRGFFGLQFRVVDDGASSEWVYLRQHNSGLPDAMQYTPVLHTGLNWQLFSGPGFTGAVDIPHDEWFHLRLAVAGAQAKLFVKDMAQPALVIDDLKSGIQRGQVGLVALTGETCFADFQVRTTPVAAWQRHPPPTPAGTIVRWSLSPAFDALARNLERPLAAADIAQIRWQTVDAEPPGLVLINRYRESPHPPVSFARDWTKRLEPQPGMQVVYARAVIDSDRDQVKKLAIGYSDDVSVFLNGAILWRGRSAQNFRDPAFLGIVDAENDAVYLPLRKSSNELVLAVSELGAAGASSAGSSTSRPEPAAASTALVRAVRSHSTLAPDEMTTFSHFAVSAAITLPKSSAEPGIGLPPSSARRARIFGSARARFTSALTLSMISFGVPFGMPMPNHAVAS
jgi:hypothetical protein